MTAALVTSASVLLTQHTYACKEKTKPKGPQAQTASLRPLRYQRHEGQRTEDAGPGKIPAAFGRTLFMVSFALPGSPLLRLNRKSSTEPTQHKQSRGSTGIMQAKKLRPAQGGTRKQSMFVSVKLRVQGSGSLPRVGAESGHVPVYPATGMHLEPDLLRGHQRQHMVGHLILAAVPYRAEYIVLRWGHGGGSGHREVGRWVQKNDVLSSQCFAPH